MDAGDMEREGGRAPHVDAAALATTLKGLKDLERNGGLDAVLGQIVDGVVAVFGVTGSGLMFVDETETSRYVVSSDEPGRVLEVAQEQLGYGPCVDALVHDRVVIVHDFARDERWPGLADIVVPAGIGSVLGVPVRVGPVAVGSLNVYCDAPHHWDDSEVNALCAFTRLVDGRLGEAVFSEQQGRLVEQLQHALESRVVIERAVGMVMGRQDLDAVTAFEHVRRLARSQRRRVAEVAAEMVGDPVPPRRPRPPA
jgi:GAF domain-containing protein